MKNVEQEDSDKNENLLKECTTGLDLSHHWVPGDIRVIMKHLDCHHENHHNWVHRIDTSDQKIVICIL